MMASTQEATRCTRADCIALREELELQKGDLEELLNENEQLHDKLAQAEAEAQSQALRTTTNDASVEQLAVKDAEIARLQTTVRELQTQLMDAKTVGRPGDDSARRGGRERATAATVDVDELRAQNEMLEAKLTELQAAMAREASSTAHAKHAMEQVAKESKDKRDELYKVLKENEMLRMEMQELQDALKKVSEIAIEYESTITVLHAQQTDYREAVDEQTLEITQLHTKLDQVEQEKHALEAKLIELDEKESDADATIRELMTKHDMEKTVLAVELEELRRRLQEQHRAISASTGTKKIAEPAAQAAAPAGAQHATAMAEMEQMEQQLEALQELRIEDRALIAELKQKILQQQNDLESLVEHLDTDTAIEKAVQAAVEAETRKTATMRQENQAFKRRLTEQSELLRDMEFRQSQLEKELVEAQQWNAKYEQNAGLEDVMKYQKKLRKELEKQQLANQKLRHDLNEQIEATGKLHVAFDRLKTEAGKPADFQYDDVAIEHHLEGELAVNQAVTKQLEHQIQELESERLKLLQKLREQARMTGHKLFENHGLTSEQWSLVEEFIDRVKHTPEVAKRLLTSSSRPHLAATSQSQQSSGVSATNAEEIAHLEKEILGLQQENANLRETIHVMQARNVGDVQEVREADTPCVPPQGDLEERTGDDNHQAGRALTHQPSITPRSDVYDGERVADAPGNVRTAASSGRSTPQVNRSVAEDDDDIESLSSRGDDDVHGQTDRDETKKLPPLKMPTALAHAEPPSSQTAADVSAEAIAQAVAKLLESRLGHISSAQATAVAPILSAAAAAVVAEAATSPLKRGIFSPTAASGPFVSAFSTEEDMAVQLDSLKELNVCIDELVKSEAQNEELRASLVQHEDAFRSLMDQQTVLYSHFAHMQDQFAKQEKALRDELGESNRTNHELRLKCERYESVLHLVDLPEAQLADSSEALRAQVIDLTRQTAVYEVNEAKLKRKYQQLLDELHSAKAYISDMDDDWLEMEKTLKTRILYLESWKQGAENALKRMEKTLDDCVTKERAKRQEETLMELLRKHQVLCEEYAEMHVNYLKLYNLPNQVSKLQHENARLRAETEGMKQTRGSDGKDGATAAESMLQARIGQLESELQLQVDRYKGLEDKLLKMVNARETHESNERAKEAAEEESLKKENVLLYERISELEQMYESLTRQCTKYQETAALAASQAHVLSRRIAQDKAKGEEREEQLRELMASSEDHAIVGQLHHQLNQLKTTYQGFVLKYEQAVEQQRQLTIRNQQLDFAMESEAKTLSEVRERSRLRIEVLEQGVAQAKERDYMARNARWDAFRKRLEVLEDELRAEQEKRKQLEKALEDAQQQPLLLESGGADSSSNALEVTRLKCRIEALEARERVLNAQLESSAKAITRDEEEELQQKLADKSKLTEDLLRQIKSMQVQLATLMKQNSELETQQRVLIHQKQDLELELQQTQLMGRLDGNAGSNQQPEQGSQSPVFMRKKVGMYEKDQADLQQAAQATIASLKLLVEEKNTLIAEYQKKMSTLRHDLAQEKAQDRVEATHLNKKLYDENQRMIQQLKEAMDTIRHMEKSGKDKKAIQAAQERHQQVLEQWKQVEMELEKARQRIKELQLEVEAITNERNIAESRAGEALEEILLLKDELSAQEKAKRGIEQQVALIKRDMGKKEDKLKLLREAIIRLKEEFLKAEDRHAVELAKAQHAAAQVRAQKNSGEGERDDAAAQWKEEKERLESQVQILQEKLTLFRKQELKRKKNERLTSQQKQPPTASPDPKAAQSVEILEQEVERLKQLVKERVVSEARAVEELEKKIKVLQAQNMALREASRSQTTGPSPAKGATESKTRLQWEEDKKLQRRQEILMVRLKEKQNELAAKEKELEDVKHKLVQVEQRARTQQQQAKDDQQQRSNTTNPRRQAIDVNRQVEELEQQNRMLQETLLLKRKEWAAEFDAQMERYEAQLKRMRLRLVQHKIALDDERAAADDTTQRMLAEEQAFLVSEEVQDELLAVSADLRQREQEVVDKDTKLMELELEVETLRLEYQRLQRQSMSAPSPSRPQPPAQQPARGRSTAHRLPMQERQELEEVIENMKRVIEKLRAENERLKKFAASGEKSEALKRKLREVQESHAQLEDQLERLRHDHGELRQEKARLLQRVRTLSLQKAPSSSPTVEKAKQLQRQLQEQKTLLVEQEMEMRRLRTDLERSEQQVHALEQELADADIGTAKKLQEQVRRLQDENEKLTDELAAFDEDFFEEIEDLKYKYAQTLREKQQLERQLQS
ncbi:TPA: hypothetical protein N0F65_000286 [Lagenidium giganteum]|uniref:Nucleoprotein TPR/MLP1 domain-containing protein n=1 Tax=Lagenidium giganteum TaxID=4803 RepID=A0AAV2Z9I2_9STRA|nr:TPA: hypothetical protein N0F65_000286 [Lagenidium giganteum]